MANSADNHGNVIRLTEDYVFKEFDCEDTDLNDFLLTDSKNFSRQLLAVTYIIENDNDIIAFFSLLNDKIAIKEAGGNPNVWDLFRKIFPDNKNNLKSYPALKIGRLAVNKKYKGNKYGQQIVNYIKQQLIDDNPAGCRFITVDAYQAALGFYEKAGFSYLNEKDKNLPTRLMYFDLLLITEN